MAKRSSPALTYLSLIEWYPRGFIDRTWTMSLFIEKRRHMTYSNSTLDQPYNVDQAAMPLVSRCETLVELL